MIATLNPQAPKDKLPPRLSELSLEAHETDLPALKSLPTVTAVLRHSELHHHPHAQLNPLVDAANYFFSLLGKLKQRKSCQKLQKIQHEMIQEINHFQQNVQNYGYSPEYLVVCRYLLCATFDDVISHTTWGAKGVWESYSLLAAFKQHTFHQDKFFNILERAIKEPSVYIDMMELIYFCLSIGYKGRYRATEHSQFQLEQITNHLYKHIRAYRGSFSKTLSPVPLRQSKSAKKIAPRQTHPLFILFVTVCIVMAIFISLGYLMDVISNEAFKNIKQIKTPVASSAIQS